MKYATLTLSMSLAVDIKFRLKPKINELSVYFSGKAKIGGNVGCQFDASIDNEPLFFEEFKPALSAKIPVGPVLITIQPLLGIEAALTVNTDKWEVNVFVDAAAEYRIKTGIKNGKEYFEDYDSFEFDRGFDYSFLVIQKIQKIVVLYLLTVH